MTLAAYRSVRHASRIRVPLWVALCEDDITVDADAIDRFGRTAPSAEPHRFAGDHFAPFTGEVTEQVIASQVDFLRRRIGP